MKVSKKVAAAVGVGAIAVAGSGVAFAYWSTTGSGSGSATVGSNYATALKITNDALTAAQTAALVPGGSTTLSVHVQNTNSGSAKDGQVTGTVAVHGSPANCSAADFSITPITGGDTIASGATKDYTTTLSFADSAVSQDGCKGATLDITWASA